MSNNDKKRREEENQETVKEKSLAAKIGDDIRGAAGFALFTGACAGAGALIGAANYFYKSVLTPQKAGSAGTANPLREEYVAGIEWLKNHPKRGNVYIRADDGLQLHAHFIPSEKADCHRYAICVHGYEGSSERMGLYARVYRERYEMNALLPDLRGHGLSDGDYIGMGYDDSRDLLRWIDWVLQKDPSAQIVLHGMSMGAAAVLMTTGHPLPEQVRAAVSDSSYTTAMKAFEALYKQRHPVIPAPVLIEAVRGVALVRAGYDLAKAAPIEAVARSKTPTLFIHGQADQAVPPAMMPQLYKAASCPKAFLWIPDAEHVQSVNIDPETYWARVERFLHAQGVELMEQD